MLIDGFIGKFFKPNVEKLKSRWDVEGLIEALSHRDDKIRAAAAKALGDMKAKEAVVALIKALKDENSEVRKTAAYALGRIGDEKAVKPLIEALKDESLDVRSEAAKSLRKIASKKALDLPKFVSETLKVSKEEAFKVFENIKSGKGFLKR